MYIVAMQPYFSRLRQFIRLLCVATMSSLAQLRVWDGYWEAEVTETQRHEANWEWKCQKWAALVMPTELLRSLEVVSRFVVHRLHQFQQIHFLSIIFTVHAQMLSPPLCTLGNLMGQDGKFSDLSCWLLNPGLRPKANFYTKYVILFNSCLHPIGLSNEFLWSCSISGIMT